MVEVEFRGMHLRFENGEWSGDPILARDLGRATGHILDMERVDCGCATRNAEHSIAEATMAHVGGTVLSMTEPEPSAA
jgi:hypothetical protein